jgi:hypothetical protein
MAENSVRENDDEVPSPKRKKDSSGRKYSGAATYKSKFVPSWQKKWPCIVPVKGNQYSFSCTVCLKTVSCEHQGERDVTRHIASAQHQRNAKALKGTTPLRFAPTGHLKDKVFKKYPYT